MDEPKEESLDDAEDLHRRQIDEFPGSFYTDTLPQCGLQEFACSLQALGVRTNVDVTFLRSEDLLGTGMSVVDMRKLRSLAGKVSNPRSTFSLRTVSFKDSDLGFKDHEADEVRTSVSPERPTRSRHGSGTDTEHGFTSPPRSRAQSFASSNGGFQVSEDGAHIAVPISTTLSVKRRSYSRFWVEQLMSRPRRLIFIRHGQSEGNVDRGLTGYVPDHSLHLTANGREQAIDAGQRLKQIIGDESVKFLVSPYVRTRETLNGVSMAWPGREFDIQEDVRIREQEFGNYDAPDMAHRHLEKRNFGPFYYRFPEGESPADCFDRASSFLESMYRAWNKNRATNYVIVGHGMMILVTLMRLLRLPVSEYGHLVGLDNCEFVVLERPKDDAKYAIDYTWTAGAEKDYAGLRRKAQQSEPEIWNGDLKAPLLTNRRPPPAVRAGRA